MKMQSLIQSSSVYYAVMFADSKMDKGRGGQGGHLSWMGSVMLQSVFKRTNLHFT